MLNIDREVRDIIKADYQKNHSGREYSVNTVLKIFDNLEKVKYSANRYGSVVIVHTPYDQDTIEFHCTNGGDTKDLIEAVNQFNKEMSEVYTWSVTFYDNPKINELLKHSFCPSEFKKIDKGIDETYEAKFRLRST